MVVRSVCITALLPLILQAAPAAADWRLDNERSGISFISIKNATIAETHSFDRLSGTVSEDGAAHLEIDLASVDTAIPIRDERMREMLFKVADFPKATISASLGEDIATLLAAGVPEPMQVPVRVTLHEQNRELETDLIALLDSDRTLHVVTAKPVVINAGDFGLTAGIEALRQIAGLDSIATAVPVTFHLVFAPAQ